MGRELNARPPRALNQRPGTAAKSMPPNRYPSQNMPKPAPQAIPKAPAAASSPSKQPMSRSMGPKVDPQAVNRPPVSSAPQVKESPVSGFVNAMRSMVSSFAILSDEVIQKNLNLASGKGMTNDDRTMSFECADYLMSNMAHIFMGLVLDKDFKDAFVQSVLVEINLDDVSDAEKNKVRESMKDTNEYKSAGSIVIGVTTFVSSINEDLMNKMSDSFDALDVFNDEFNSAVANLTEDQKVEYGFIFSNFMYLIRAFTHNDMFLSYVITVVEGVKEKIKSMNP